MNIAIIGAGLIGKKRGLNIDQNDRIVAVCDLNLDKANQLADEFSCESLTDWRHVISRSDIDAVVIATVHSALAEITLYSIRAGLHVLVEKPAARNADELEPVFEEYQKLKNEKHLVVKVGFNHRFHPAFQKAKEIMEGGKMGQLMFIRGRYGHGGRIGYDKEWRADPEISGGGELLDQGMHLIDLSRWFLGDFTKIQGTTKTFFWDMPVDDNAFMLLETAVGQVAQLHVSWSEWKNLFSFEIYGKTGKLHIEGLGGSYGMERISFYEMKPEMGPPPTTIYEFPGVDVSWNQEWKNFKAAVEGNKKTTGDIEDAYQALKVVRTLYQQSN
jgi:predicted dehydrogenase